MLEAVTDYSDLNARIATVINLYENPKNAAEVAGVSVDQLAQYSRGVNQPTFAAVVALAKKVGVSLDWLATGQGSMFQTDSASVLRSDLDPATMRMVIEEAESYLQEQGLAVKPQDKVTLLFSLYEIAKQSSDRNASRESFKNVIKLVTRR